MAAQLENSFYSRHRYAFGDEAMQKIISSNIFLAGAGGIGAEIAKNLVMAGVSHLTIQDNKCAMIEDLGGQFFLCDDDVRQQRNRAVVTCQNLSEINSSVSINVMTRSLDLETELDFLTNFHCVILTEVPMQLQLKVNEFCRSQHHQPIRFISADVRGLFCWAFVDFGPRFEVTDDDGEQSKSIYVSYISKANPGVVTLVENKQHGLNTGDRVKFSQVQGMNRINGESYAINVVSPFSFTIGNTSSDEFEEYRGGGTVQKIKEKRYIDFEPLSTQLCKPSIQTFENGKTNDSRALQLAIFAYYSFLESQKRLPVPWDETDANLLVTLARQINESANNMFPINSTLTKKLAMSARGALCPLNAIIGGIVAQEALKAVTGHLTPLKQWLNFQCGELMDLTAKPFPSVDRYQNLRFCLKENVLAALADVKMLLVGSGSIGCEILKNCALLGVGRNNGKITITDSDLIESSNLGTQLLFRPHNNQQAKSLVAMDALRLLNPDLKLSAHNQRVCPQATCILEETLFKNVDWIVTAVDNIEGRRYIDSLCIKYTLPLFDSGAAGTKGHVQVVLPHETETYVNKFDPPEEEIPYCVLKSFPSTIEHTIQWARDKFDSFFHSKPIRFNNFWMQNDNIEETVQLLKSGDQIRDSVLVIKMLKQRPNTIQDCIVYARHLFEKYFNHKAQQLLYTFPVDTKIGHGENFWQSPKRAPAPVKFDVWNKLHVNFIKCTTRLIAHTFGIKECLPEKWTTLLISIEVPQFYPKNKVIETSESAKKSQSYTYDLQEPAECAAQIITYLNSGYKIPDSVWMRPLEFQGGDSNTMQMDFIVCASNIRAAMYGIDMIDKFKIKNIAEKIVPLTITTTSVLAGLLTLELIKSANNFRRELHQNYFLNLALPLFISSQPGEVARVQLKADTSFSIWDKWEIRGNPNFTLQQLIDQLVAKSGRQVSLVVEGTRMIYIPIMPGHKKRCSNPLLSLLKKENEFQYCDLSVGFEHESGEDIMGPPVRYYLS